MAEIHQQTPIFVISLKEAEQRRKLIKEAMERAQLEYEFFDAIFGADLDKNFLARFNINEMRRIFQRDLAAGEIGCIFSHYFLWKKIIKEDIPAAIILEDDAKWSETFPILVKNFHLVSKYQWDVIHIGYWIAAGIGRPLFCSHLYPLSFFNIKKLKLMPNNSPAKAAGQVIYLGDLIEYIEGTHAYAINKVGANKLVEMVDTDILVPLDEFFHLHRRKYRRSAIVPISVEQNSDPKIEQHIKYERLGSKPNIHETESVDTQKTESLKQDAPLQSSYDIEEQMRKVGSLARGSNLRKDLVTTYRFLWRKANKW